MREEGEWCAVLDRVTMEPIPNFRGVECGVAGPIYGGSIHGGVSFYQPQHERNATGYSVEYGSEKYLGQVVKTYKKGETISVVLFIPANHRGFVEFRLCEAPENADPTKECFENNKLKFENGQDRADVMSGQINGNDFTYKVQLPEEKTCEHCVFQWYWYGALTSQLYISKFFFGFIKIKLIHFILSFFHKNRCC